jgi:hypothetical protein
MMSGGIMRLRSRTVRSALLGTALCCPLVPFRRKLLGFCLHNELADAVGYLATKLHDEVLELGLGWFIQPQHEARGIVAGIMGAPR